jgi:hypothetical protein
MFIVSQVNAPLLERAGGAGVQRSHHYLISYVQQLAVQLLSNLSTCEENHVAMLQGGCIPPLILLVHHEDPQTQRQAMKCLANVTESEETKVCVIRNGGLAHFLALSSSRSEELQLLACKCLANLAKERNLSKSWSS